MRSIVNPDVEKFAMKVVEAVRGSYPSLLTPTDWPAEITYAMHSSNLVGVYAEFPDKENESRTLARLSFMIALRPMGGAGPNPTTLHVVLNDELRILKPHDGQLGLASCRFVGGPNAFVVPALTPYEKRMVLARVTAAEREHWLAANLPEFYNS